MPKLRRGLILAVLLAPSASALGPPPAAAFTDPSSNFFTNPPCSTSADCLQQAVGVLDAARARLGEAPYALPGNFAALTPAEQAFVLTDLDRLASGLAPVSGLSSGLDQVAASAVGLDTDPMSSAAGITALTANWAGGYRNLPLAYEAWMYDDGPGGANVDCTTVQSGGCWQHRHNILWPFWAGGPLVMGAAAGTDARGTPSYAMLIVQGDAGFASDLVYSWSDAVAAGAGADGAITHATGETPKLRPHTRKARHRRARRRGRRRARRRGARRMRAA